MAVTTKKTFPATTNATTTVFSPVGIQLNNQDDLDVYVTLSGGTRVLQLRQATASTAQSSHPQVNNTDGLYFPAVSAGTTLYNYTLSSDNNTITFNSALPSGAIVFCERRTRDADSAYTTFASGSTIRATDLNNSSTESNFTAQDARNKALDLENAVFGGTQPTINGVVQPFVDSSKIIDGSIATVDIADAQITTGKLADSSVTQDKLAQNAVSTVKIAGSAVTEAKIASNAVTTAKISDANVTTAKIADGNITHAKIQDNAVITAKLADGNVTSAKLATGSVTTAKLATDSVTNAKIAADAITGAEIADNTINSEHYIADSIDSEHYAPGSVNTVAIEDTAITTPKIANSNVTTAKLDNDAVTASKLADNAVVTANIVDANVTHVKLANDAVDGDNIADNSINSEHYVDGSIDTAHIADNQITTAKIAADAVTNAKIADDSIDSEHYVDGSIDTAHIADAQITTAKIADGAITDAKIAGGSLDNRYFTETELLNGALDGRYFTETEADARYFNVSTGDTIKDGDTFPDNDTTIATTAAINDRIIDLVDDVGGFVPIANETSFPTANPDVNNGSGTLVSIKSIGSTRTPTGGIVTISNGSGSNTVTITGCGSTVLTAGFGAIVETTSTLHTYAFHRLVPKATEITTVSGISSDITTVANNTSNINAVAADASDIGTVAGSITNVNNVGNNISNVNSVAGNETNINAVNANSTNIDAVAGNNSNITTVANNQSNINAVAADVSDIGIVAADGTDIGLVAGSISSVNTTAGSIANVNTVASNISNVNNFAQQYRIGSSNPTSSLDTGDLFFNTSTSSLKVYTGSAWVDGVTTTGDFALKTGNTFTGSNIHNDNVKSIYGTGSDLEIFHNGSHSHIIDNGTGNIRIQTNGGGIELQQTNGENLAKFITDGAVELYHNNGLKIATTSSGVSVTGNIAVSGNVDGRDVAADGVSLDSIEQGNIGTNVTNGNIKLEPNGTGVVEVRGAGGNDGTLQLNCSQQSHGIKLKSPAHSAGQSYTLTFPTSLTANGVLTTDGNGTLSAALLATANIADSAVTNAKLATNSISNAKMQDNAINSNEIVNSAVLTAKIADSAVTTAKIADDAVTTAKIADDAITAAQIADNAVGSAAIANDSITANELANNSVGNSHIIDGTISNAEINGSAAIAGSKINPSFVDNITITNTTPTVTFTDSNNNSDFKIKVESGQFDIDDTSNSNATRFRISSNGTISIPNNLDASGGIDVTGNITVTGTVDGRDVAADGTKLDGVESGATADQTAAEIRTLVESATDSNVFTDADHTKLNGIETGATADQTAAEIRTLVGNASDSNVFTDADHAKLDALTTSNGVILNGVTATTQSASDNSTKIATTAYTDTAISNLVDSSPAALNTLNELAAAIGDDANFSTTITNSIATKMPLAGGTFTGDVTFTGDSYNGVWDKSDNSLIFADNAKVRLGSGSDLQMYHNGTNSFIENQTGYLRITGFSGQVYIQSNDDVRITGHTADEDMAVFHKNGAVELYHDNSKKFETTSSGVTVTGAVSDSSGNLRSLGVTTHNSSSLTLSTSHRGHIIREATNGATITIPSGTFSAGDIITVFNISGGNNTIAQGSGTTLYNTGDSGSTGNVTLESKGVCTIVCTSSNEFIISGSGLG